MSHSCHAKWCMNYVRDPRGTVVGWWPQGANCMGSGEFAYRAKSKMAAKRYNQLMPNGA